jgi:alginate O-acetyltransferase complex protein AlgI
MTFTEVEFAFFLPVAFAIYWLSPRRRIPQNLILIGLSILFYITWNWRVLWVLVTGALVDFFVMRLLSRRGSKTTNGTVDKLALAISLCFSLGMLGFFKYERFFAESFNVLGLGTSLPVVHLLLPLGLSFFTLQRIALVLDVYWRRQEAPNSFIDYLLFCCFFPQLTAGPISRGSQLLPQLQQPRRLQAQHLTEGATSFLLGFALKAWGADVIGTGWVDPVFADPTKYNRTSHVLAVIGYPLQVFADFAGYSLMAIGVALLFGIQLPVNFDNPFLSRNLPELWRRWHITLNRWLFDYIFTPLTTSRGWFRGKLDVALLVTFLASGLWHGAAWTFVIWGALHGIGMVVQRNWDEYYRKLCRRDRRFVSLRKSNGYQTASWGVTLAFFIFTLIAFRATGLSNCLDMLRGLVSPKGQTAVHLGVSGAVLAAAFVTVMHLLGTKQLTVWRDRFYSLPAPVRGLVYGLFIAFLAIRVPVSAGAFIYQQF